MSYGSGLGDRRRGESEPSSPAPVPPPTHPVGARTQHGTGAHQSRRHRHLPASPPVTM